MTSDLIKVIILEIIILLGLFLFYKCKGGKLIKKHLFNFIFDFKKPLLTIALPTLIGFLEVLIYILFFRRIVAYNAYLPVLIFDGVILGPIFEEILLRGVFFGVFIKLSKNLKRNFSKAIFIFTGFILQLLLFVFGHMRFGGREVSILLIGGTVYGLLFLIYKRNLVPSIIAHAISNLFVILINI